jgi:uncharacterized protein YfaS (alpha-2-macroglobulin family)
MSLHFKRVFSTVVILSFFIASAGFANLQNADSKFKSKLYNEAAKLYEEEVKKDNYKSLEVEIKEEIVLKLTQSLILSNAFEKALLQISKLNLTEKSKNYPFYLLLKAKSFEKYLQNYRYQMQQLVVEGETDILKKSPAYFEGQIREITQNLWQNRLEYLNIVLTENLYLFDMSSADSELIPTFYDYLMTQFQANYQWQNVKEFNIEKMLKEASEVEVKSSLLKSMTAPFSQSEINKKRSYIREKWLIELKKREWQIPQYVDYEFNFTESKEEKEAIEKNKELSDKMNSFLVGLKTSRAKSEWYVLLAKNEFKNKDFEKSYTYCEKALDLYKSQISAECFEIQRSIANKEMNFAHGLFDSEEEIEVPLKVRNFDKIFIRLYEVPFDGNWDKALSDFRSSTNAYLDNERIKKCLLEKPVLETEISANTKRKHTYSETLIKISKRQPGRYIILASEHKSFEFEKKFIAGTFVLVSDLVMLTQTGIEFNSEKSLAVKDIMNLPTQHFYYFNFITGKLEKNVNLLYSLNHKANQLLQNQNDKSSVWDDWDFTGQQRLGYGHQLYAVAYKGKSFSYLNQYINKTHQQKVDMIIEKDRPIYRPGQKINFKVMALQRVPFGWQVMPFRKVTVTIKDANYKQAHTVDLKLNEMGSSSGEFEIPKTALLGNYHIEALIQDQDLNLTNVVKNFTEYFKVEEYKRPEFFVEIPKSESVWVFNKKSKILIKAKYYHGTPVKNAVVNYNITPQAFWPWFYRPWFYDQIVTHGTDPSAEQKTAGSGTTNDKGELEIEYTPQSKSESPMQYSVKVDIRDTGGRTISGNQSFYANKSEYVIQLVQDKNFFFSNENPKYTVDLKDLNGRKYAGDVRFVLSEVLPPTSEQLKKLKDKEKNPYGNPEYPYYPQFRRGYASHHTPEHDVNFYLKDLTKKEVEKKNLKVKLEKSLNAEFSILKEGFYHLKAESLDSQNVSASNELYFMVYQNGEMISQFYLPKFTLLEKKSYQVGDKIKIIFGSSQLMGDAVVNVLRRQFLGANKIYSDKIKFRLFEFKAEDQFQRNVTFTWFGWGERKVIQGSENIEIEPYNKKLNLVLEYKKELKPRDKQSLKIKVENSSANLEGLLKVYDQSLEYYGKDSKDRFMELYSSDESSQPVYAFEFYPQTTPVPEKINVFSAMIELFRKNVNLKRPPRLNIDFDMYAYRGRGGENLLKSMEVTASTAGNMEMDSLASVPGMKPQSIGAMGGTAPAAEDKAGAMKEEALSKKDSSSKRQEQEDQESSKVQVRSDFSETAVFSPQIEFKGRNASVEFKLPDQLTTWKLETLVVGKNGTLGQGSGSFITSKSLMTKLQLPRFFREKDQSEIRVFVENKSKKDLSGFVKITLEQEGKDVYALYAKELNKKNWTLKAGGQVSLAWKVEVPSTLSDLKIKTVGMSGEEADAEERIIPVLPSRERLIESQISFLDDKLKTKLVLPKWNEKDETRVNEQIAVQVDPQLPLMLLNSIPSLINYPYHCSEQLINKFVPLAIVNSLYEKNPKLKEALKKVPLRSTFNLPWEDKDPRRLINLMETPWKRVSEGLTSPWDLIQLTDSEQVEKIKRYVFTELQNRQLSSGGFSWFSGGKEDLYITLIVLEGFSEAMKYRVDIPKDMISKALDYVYSELPKHLKAESSELQFLIYGSYIFSSFDEVGLKMSKNKDALKSWVPFIEKNDHLITQLGYAYLANIYQRMNQKEKMEKSLKRAFDGMKTDDLIGSYWAPEEKSWIWYNDSVEKHAFFIQTLVELKPKDERIKNLVKWLLFNRKGNEWKSTKTSAKAIYSLIGFMKNSGALDKSTLVDLKWGDLSKKIDIDPFEFKKEPLRFIKTENFKPGDGVIDFKKTGTLPVIASSTWIYTSDKINSASASSVLSLDRQFYQVKGDANKQTLAPLKSEAKIKVGDEVEVQLKINAKSQLEYIHLKDPRGSGFEANQLLSGYVWDLLARYEEPRDSLTNFFISWLPKGEYILKHRFKATTKGKYKFGSALIQSMYSPDMSAYSSGMILEVD